MDHTVPQSDTKGLHGIYGHLQGGNKDPLRAIRHPQGANGGEQSRGVSLEGDYVDTVVEQWGSTGCQ